MTDKTLNTAPRTILLKGRGTRHEAVADGTILPGSLLQFVSSTGHLTVHSSAGARATRIFALENELFGLGIDDNYVSGDNVQAEFAWNGMWVNAAVAAGAAAIVTGDYLESAGDGTLRKSVPSGAGQAASASQGSANTQVTYTANQVGTGGNLIRIVVSAASGGGSVTVSGLLITIVPVAASDTVTSLIAQIAGSAAAANLITATTTGNGTGGSTATTGLQLANGIDAGGSAGEVVAQAMGSLNNSSASSVGRLPVVVV